jgi:hypothetical protein
MVIIGDAAGEWPSAYFDSKRSGFSTAGSHELIVVGSSNSCSCRGSWGEASGVEGLRTRRFALEFVVEVLLVAGIRSRPSQVRGVRDTRRVLFYGSEKRKPGAKAPGLESLFS